MSRFFGLWLLLFFFITCDKGLDEVSDPAFFTRDVDLFWQVYDSNENPADIDFQKLYIDKGSAGLKDYATQKNLAAGLKNTLYQKAYRDYYDAIRPNTGNYLQVAERSGQAFETLKEIHPATKFYNVYFMIGAMTSGGRISKNGLLIAVEMFSRSDNTNVDNLSSWHRNVTRNKEYLPSIVVHEFIHMQQNFTSRNSRYTTLLEQSIREGMADFISFYLLPDQPFMNDHLHQYGEEHEQELWELFSEQKDMNYKETQWLYSGTETSQGYPADMGYYMGFKILESFAATFESTESAISAMLSNGNYVYLFEQSGYADKFDE